MPPLVIPPSGLAFEGPRTAGPAGPIAFGITLRDSVIEEMIKCFNNKRPLQISLGEHPSLQYGSKTQHLSTHVDPFPHEIFQTSNSNFESDSSSTTMAPDKKAPPKKNEVHTSIQQPHFQWLAMMDPKSFAPTKEGTALLVAKNKRAGIPTDAAVTALKNSLASENAKKAGNTTKYIKDGAGLPAPGRPGGPPGKASAKAKLLSSRPLAGDTSRSLPSPGLSGAGSPSLGPTSVPLSQQQLAQAKATRKPVVHLLALNPLTEVALRAKIPSASNSEIKQALQKVGDLNQSTGKWELRRLFFKELDVWTFEYDSSADRDRVIDNAVKQYDKMRLGRSEPEWDKLLPEVERGTDKCLSKLQAQIAQSSAARVPKSNGQKGDGSSRDASNEEDEEGSSDKNSATAKGEAVTSSVSPPLPAKAKKAAEKKVTEKKVTEKKVTEKKVTEKKATEKKVTEKKAPEKEIQTKRWMSKQAPKPKPSPTKKEKPVTKPVLSSQFVMESDDEDEVAPANQGPNTLKRAREDEEESSDSGVPLSKKIKDIHRKDTHSKDAQSNPISDASQPSQMISTSSKSKGKSPQKPSPLSSPPTNASEFESFSGHISSSASPAHHDGKGARSPIYKRHQKSSSVTSSASSSTSHRALHPEVVYLARRYRSFYPKYEALHREVANSGGRRNIKQEQELMDMHERLSELKKKILLGVVYVEN